VAKPDYATACAAFLAHSDVMVADAKALRAQLSPEQWEAVTHFAVEMAQFTHLAVDMIEAWEAPTPA
jgi:hypothetical protein